MSAEELYRALEMGPEVRAARLAEILERIGDLEATVAAIQELKILILATLAGAEVIDAAQAIVEGTPEP